MSINENSHSRQEETIWKEIEFIRREIIIINDLIQQHLDFVESTSSPQLLDKINIAPAFFTLSINSIRLQILLRVCRLFEEKPDSLTIRKILNKAEQNKSKMTQFNIFYYSNCDDQTAVEKFVEPVNIQEAINEFKNRLDDDSVCVKIQQLKHVKNKFLSHNDLKHATALEKESPIPIEDIYKLMKIADEVCAFCELRYFDIGYSCQSSNSSDLLKLLEHVKCTHKCTINCILNDTYRKDKS